MSTTQAQQPTRVSADAERDRKITVYAHSPLFYWWPVWAFGFGMALLTYLYGKPYTFESTVDGRDLVKEVTIHPSGAVGVVFTVVFVLVILMTNITLRGLASLSVVIGIVALTFIFAYFGVWDPIVDALGQLALFMNLGFYVFFSTAVFVLWLLAFFVYDRLEYWTFYPGQMVHNQVFGGGEDVYHTDGMVVNKLRDDLFRHWILGLGSGDMTITTTGARKETFVLRNVLFVTNKLNRVQKLVAMRPDDTMSNTTTAGEPN